MSKPWLYSVDKKYFVYDPEDGISFYKTIEERDKAAKEAIETYLDDGEWYEGVETIIAGEITHKVKPTNVIYRPEDHELDDDGCDSECVYWGDHHKMCQYELKEIGDIDV